MLLVIVEFVKCEGNLSHLGLSIAQYLIDLGCKNTLLIMEDKKIGNVEKG